MEFKDYQSKPDYLHSTYPEAICIEVYTERNTQVEVVLRVDSYSAHPLHFEIIAEPEHGVLIDQDDSLITQYPVQLAGESIRYSPNMHFIGRDIFSYQLIDGKHAMGSKSAVVVICVFDAHRADEVYLPILELNMEKILKHEFQKYEVDKRLTWETIEDVALVYAICKQ